MLQKYNKWKVLKVFFENPNPEGAGFQLREIGRITKLATTSVKRYLNELVNEELIIISKHRIHAYPVYRANLDSEKFRFLKKIDTIMTLKDSGLIEFLESKCMPDVIILFGSASRGEDTIESDIDLYMLCKERKMDLQDFEKRIKRKISLFFSKDFVELSNELKNNIINGIILKGYLKVF
ncbi:MAG: nucleotidyltransferase domain-containing protein [Candidatus Methanoperedens sp.]|nr:nucleotidyltransferase domain-containing protein [Candidatus Methanoperedens sp.]MCZ7369948.1 nucleotidyltransferase domain-containing protein [Candidatus Methanoperedens sp.]